ncbi:MAG: CHAT domain-containing protein [Acidobacteria bacterium]|nr:CHAT domain-containing protein [Acidobacteriota bacterium]MBV9474853.1 CHAT domain-containing protein [Acidobacteriota bacterium]
MSTLTEPSNHLDPETLAGLADGTLDASARRAAIEHVSVCGECRSVFMTATELSTAAQPTRIRPFRSRWWMAATAALLAAIAALYVYRFLPGRSGSADIAKLIAAADDLESRPIEGRLSGGFSYKEYNHMRGGEGGQDGSDKGDEHRWALMAAAADIRHAADAHATPKNLHAVGVAELLLGDPRAAVTTLEKALTRETHQSSISAAITASQDATLLNDLSAAYSARALYTRARTDDLAAAECVQRAWNLEHSPPIAWNRALALTAVGLQEDAKVAWADYLRLDPQSPWATEARQKLSDLNEPTSSSSWDGGALLARAIARSDAAAIARLVAEHPRQMRDAAEARIVDGADSDDFALRTAAATFERRGDAFLAAALADLRRNGSAGAASGLQELRQGQQLQKTDVQRAATLLEAASEHLRAYTRLEWLSRLATARAQWYCARYDVALREIARVRGSPAYDAKRYPTLDARLSWIEGLAYVASDRAGAAGRPYASALAQLTKAGETDTIAALQAMIAERASYLRAADDGWGARIEGIAGLYRAGDHDRLHVSLQEMLQSLLRDDQHPRLAVAVASRLKTIANVSGDPTAIADADLWYAVAMHRSGARGRAEAAFRRASYAATAIADPSTRERAVENYDAVLARTIAATEPAIAMTAANRYLGRTARRSDTFRVADVFLARGIAHQQLRDSHAARADFRTALRYVEQQRRELLNPVERISYLDVAAEASQRLLGELSRDGEWGEALIVAEHSRARLLAERRNVAPQNDARAIAAQVPANTALLEWAVLPDALLVWCVTSNDVIGVRIAAPTETVAAAVHRVATCMAQLSLPCEGAVADLHDLLLPLALRARVGPNEMLVLVPDAAFDDEVPFSALYDRSRGEYLIEQHAAIVAPSAAVALSGAAASSARDTVLVVAERAAGGDRQLTPLASADAEARGVIGAYPRSTSFYDRQATQDVIRAAATDADVIHLIGHSKPATSADDGPGFALGAQETTLSPETVGSWTLRRQPLVVLANCRTATGKTRRAEGSLSLARAFLAAGAGAVVAPLYDIDDTFAATFFSSFHRRIRGGMTAADALRGTQLQYLHSPSPLRRRPQYWGALRVLGPIERRLPAQTISA